MRIEKLQEGYSIDDDDNTVYTYNSITSSDEGVYCLYSGALKDKYYSKRIFFFDWDGNLKKTLLLNKTIVSIYLDTKNNTIYCYSDIDDTIYSCKL